MALEEIDPRAAGLWVQLDATFEIGSLSVALVNADRPLVDLNCGSHLFGIAERHAYPPVLVVTRVGEGFPMVRWHSIFGNFSGHADGERRGAPFPIFTLRFDLALGVCRRHAPKVAKNRKFPMVRWHMPDGCLCACQCMSAHGIDEPILLSAGLICGAGLWRHVYGQVYGHVYGRVYGHV